MIFVWDYISGTRGPTELTFGTNYFDLKKYKSIVIEKLNFKSYLPAERSARKKFSTGRPLRVLIQGIQVLISVTFFIGY